MVVFIRTKKMEDAAKEQMGGYAALTHKIGAELVHLHGGSVAGTLVDYIRQ